MMRVRFRYLTYTAGPATETQQSDRNLERLFHDLWHVRQRTMLPAGEWRPPTDVYETPDGLVVKMELAGVSEETIEITLYTDRLIVVGTRHDKQPAGEHAAFHEAGIHYGPFRAEVRLPRPVDGEQVTAALDSGFLVIHLPRPTVQQ